MTRLLALPIMLLVFAATMPAAATEASYLPLEYGNRWAYSSDLVGPDIKEVVPGPSPVFGDAYTIRYLVSDHSPGLENYWSTNEAGDVYLHGFRRLNPRRAFFYDPPLKVVDAPLYPGKTWVSAVDLSTTPGGDSLGRYVVRYTVTNSEVHVIEGVTVVAFGVLETAESEGVAGLGSEWLTDGRPNETGKAEVVVPHWWAQGVGEIQYRSLGIFHLVSYSLSRVDNEQSSWSELKRLYR